MTSAAVLLAALLTLAFIHGVFADGSTRVFGLPAVSLCAALAFGIQWLLWIPASALRTEHFYDLTGGMTYVALALFSLWAGAEGEIPSARQWLLSLLVLVWALRLSSFLYRRVRRAGRDGRFDSLKTSPVRFFVPWTLQGMWVSLTLLVVLVVNSHASSAPPLGLTDLAGVSLWLLGFGIEVAADLQKARFAQRPENRGRWIDEGLWARSRHPNYFGEILLWCGIAVLGSSSLSGAEWLALVSPVFVALLLMKVSGVPLLDERALERWGDDPEYLAYRRRTRVLLPIGRPSEDP